MFGLFKNKQEVRSGVTKQEVLGALREHGADDLRVRQLLNDWLIQQEALADSMVGHMSDEARVLLGVDMAEIYLALGDKNEARGYYDFALYEAKSLGKHLYDNVIKRIDGAGFANQVFSEQDTV